MGISHKRKPSGVTEIITSIVAQYISQITSISVGASAMHKIIAVALKLIARILGANFHENFHMTQALASLYDDGMLARGSGFVFEDGDKAVGIYVVTYHSNESDNLGGRWN
jgi:hypothetical protein